jgi:CubicO group peptidase (beta-lactamase class C family)
MSIFVKHKSLLITLVVITVLLSSCGTYLEKVVVYNDPGLDDYKILPYRTVHAEHPSELYKSKDYMHKAAPDSLMHLLSASKSVAFLVFRNDSLVYEWYDRGFSEASPVNPFSATKSIVSILTGVALREGKLKSLDQQVGIYYAPFALDGKEQIRFKDLLTMRSGLNWQDNYFNPFSRVARLYYGSNLNATVNSLKVEVKPGSEFRYKNCDPQILTLALENAVGTNMSDYATQKLWNPLGMEYDGLWLVDKEKGGHEKSYCCLHATAHDLARIGMLYENQGNWRGTQIVDTAYVHASLLPADTTKPCGIHGNNYGYLWWLKNIDGLGDFAAEGMKGQWISVNPKEHLIFVRLGKRDYVKFDKPGRQPSLYRQIFNSVRGSWKTAVN